LKQFEAAPGFCRFFAHSQRVISKTPLHKLGKSMSNQLTAEFKLDAAEVVAEEAVERKEARHIELWLGAE
jgi:hypothetical protein